LGSINVSIEDIDTWVGCVRLPKGQRELKKYFFAERVVRAPESHIKAFASEVFSATLLLGLAADHPLMPQILCFDLFRTIMRILQRDNIEDLGTLLTATRAYHQLYMQFYHRIAKLHAQHHIADFWELWGQLLSCFC